MLELEYAGLQPQNYSTYVCVFMCGLADWLLRWKCQDSLIRTEGLPSPHLYTSIYTVVISSAVDPNPHSICGSGSRMEKLKDNTKKCKEICQCFGSIFIESRSGSGSSQKSQSGSGSRKALNPDPDPSSSLHYLKK